MLDLIRGAHERPKTTLRKEVEKTRVFKILHCSSLFSTNALSLLFGALSLWLRIIGSATI